MTNEQVASLLATAEGYWYVATVYTQDPLGWEHAFWNACKAGAFLVERGVKVYVPIAHTHTISKIVKSEFNTHAVWMAQDEPMVKSAVGLIVVKMPGWDKSKGIGMEIQWAKEQGKPTYYLEWPLDGIH